MFPVIQTLISIGIYKIYQFLKVTDKRSKFYNVMLSSNVWTTQALTNDNHLGLHGHPAIYNTNISAVVKTKFMNQI